MRSQTQRLAVRRPNGRDATPTPPKESPAWAPGRRWRRRQPVGIFVILMTLAAVLVVSAPPASANLSNVFTADAAGDLADQFTNTDALFVYVITDIDGGRVCIV